MPSSLQYHYGFHLCDTTLVDHQKLGNAQNRENRPLRDSEFGHGVSRLISFAPLHLSLYQLSDIPNSVAIVAAVRVSWKDDGNTRDPYYIWRNALSQIWYSSEITGTIIVQCIPILRTMIKDIQTSMTSKKLHSSYERQSTVVISSKRNSKRLSAGVKMELVRKGSERIELKEIPEEPQGTWAPPASWKKIGVGESLSSLDEENALPLSPRSDRWARDSGGSGGYGPRNGQSLDSDQGDRLHSFTAVGADQRDGLSPPPQRKSDSQWPLG